MSRSILGCLGFLVGVILILTGMCWLVAYLLGWPTLLWWVAYIFLCIIVGPDERIPARVVWAILIGAPVVVGMIGFRVAGLKGGLGGGLPMFLPPAVWLADKIDSEIRKRRRRE